MATNILRRQMIPLIATAPILAMVPALADAPVKSLGGIMPIVTTPYTSSGDIDFEDLAREISFFDRIGCKGAVWPQASSDVDLMSREERMQGMRVIAQACRPLKVASILGVQGHDISQMLDYARHAHDLNVDAVIAMPPSSSQLQSEEGYYAYFSALASAVRCPVVLQTSIPGFRGAITPSVNLIMRLAHEFPNLAYIKEESAPLIPRMKEEVGHHNLLKGIFGASGGDGLLYEMRLGLDGEMTGQGAYGDVMVAVFNWYRQGRRNDAVDAYSKLLLMKNCEQNIPGTQRYIFVKRGVFKSAAVRPGAVGGAIGHTLSADAIDEIEMRFAALKPYLAAI